VTFDETQMQRALELAERGRGGVEPNPMVGAVVLDAQSGVVGEGLHESFGGPHAEVNALARIRGSAVGGTLYVTLEPCCHFGKTPPCTKAIIAARIRRVVVAMRDPFPKVDGGGIRELENAGIKVVVGVCEQEAIALNAAYLKLIRTGKPWVIAKWAMSLDGKIATRTGDSQWISGEESRKHAHELRARVDGILVGSGTVFADDPMLTARPSGKRTLARIVLTRSGKLPETCKLRSTARETPVIVFTTAEGADHLSGWKADGAEVIAINGIGEMLSELGRRCFTNLLIEGGAGILGAFSDANELDEVRVYIAPKLIGGKDAVSPMGGLGIGKLSDGGEWQTVKVEQFAGDICITARKT
jgi:diaminohydroxyphosphoribosylaminopyrimidine deaminase/5-amino-6-(5-phosphoribosylamino)uracil reductase